MLSINKCLRLIKFYLTISMVFSYCSLATSKFDDYRDLINPHTKVVFTCDGGGMRGIIPLVIAAEIEKRVGVGIAQACDLMEGTSTGGILTLGLNCPDENNPQVPKYRADDLLDIYNKYGKTIFPSNSLRKFYTLNGTFGSRYSGDGIEQVAKQYFGDYLLSSSITKVGIVGNQIDPDTPYMFYSDDFETEWYMRDVVKATSAAPTYLPAAEIHPLEKITLKKKEKRHFVDGGISGMNNPSARAYVDALAMIRQEIKEELKLTSSIESEVVSRYLGQDIRLISLGTGEIETHQSYEKMRNAGVIGWVEPLIHLTLSMPSDANDQQMRTSLPSYKDSNGQTVTPYFRLNPKITKELEAMDNASTQNCAALEQVGKDFIQQNEEAIDQIANILKARLYYKSQEQKHLDRQGTPAEKTVEYLSPSGRRSRASSIDLSSIDNPITTEHAYHKYNQALTELSEVTDTLKPRETIVPMPLTPLASRHAAPRRLDVIPELELDGLDGADNPFSSNQDNMIEYTPHIKKNIF